MKINDVTITEAVYGFDDIRTAASSFAKNLLQGATVNDATNYAMRDRAVRLVARGALDQWKNIVYDLRRMYEKDIKANPAKGKQNKSTVESRLTDLVYNNFRAGRNHKEVADLIQSVILPATITQSGQFAPPGQLSSGKVLDAFTKIVASAVVDTAYRNSQAAKPNQQQNQKDTPVSAQAPTVHPANTFKTKDPNDYGKALSAPLDQMFKYDDRNAQTWFDNAIIPVKIVIQVIITNNNAIELRRYFKYNGQWYTAHGTSNNPRLSFSQNQDVSASTTAAELLGSIDLDRVVLHGAEGLTDPDTNILWSGNWAVQRVDDSRANYIILDKDKYQKWAEATDRVVNQDEPPYEIAQAIRDFIQ